jgi:hypothetical protein
VPFEFAHAITGELNIGFFSFEHGISGFIHHFVRTLNKEYYIIFYTLFGANADMKFMSTDA